MRYRHVNVMLSVMRDIVANGIKLYVCWVLVSICISWVLYFFPVSDLSKFFKAFNRGTASLRICIGKTVMFYPSRCVSWPMCRGVGEF